MEEEDKGKSFLNSLLQSRFNENSNEKNFDEEVESLSIDDELYSDEEVVEDIETYEEVDNGVPRIKLPMNLLKKIRRPWKKCLIVRLLGITIGYNYFLSKVKNGDYKVIWKRWTLETGSSLSNST